MSRLVRIGACALLVHFAFACGDLSPRVGPPVTAGGNCADDAGTSCDAGEGGTRAALVSFERDIRPLMDRDDDDPTTVGCRDCHYNTSPSPKGLTQAQLDLTTLGSLRKGGKSTGAAIIVPGDPESSAIVKKLRGTYSTGKRMPQSGPPYWTDAQIQLMVDWIAQGAHGEDDE